MTTITIVDSLWRHNENCCYANMRSQGQASCLLTLEFKCHLRYCSSQEVDVLLSVSLPYSTILQCFMLISDVYRSFIQNKTTFTKYCLTQWISKLPRSFEIHWVRQYLANVMGLAGMLNTRFTTQGLQDRANFHTSRAWQIILIFNRR